MSQITDGKRRTFKAGSGLTSAQYHIVKQDTDGTVILATAGTDVSVGIIDNAPAAGDNASVTLRSGQGTSKVVLGTGGATYGSKLTATTGGVAIITTTNKDEVIGVALQAGNAGDTVEIQLANYTLSA